VFQDSRKGFSWKIKMILGGGEDEKGDYRGCGHFCGMVNS
jgi:hypothetical protein